MYNYNFFGNKNIKTYFKYSLIIIALFILSFLFILFKRIVYDDMGKMKIIVSENQDKIEYIEELERKNDIIRQIELVTHKKNDRRIEELIEFINRNHDISQVSLFENKLAIKGYEKNKLDILNLQKEFDLKNLEIKSITSSNEKDYYIYEFEYIKESDVKNEKN